MTGLKNGIQRSLMVALPAVVLLGAAGSLFKLDRTLSPTPVEVILLAALAPIACGVLLFFLKRGVDLTLVASCGMLTSISTATLLQVSQIPGGSQAFFQIVVFRHAVFVVAAFSAMAVGALITPFIARLRHYPYVTAAIALVLIGSTILVGTEVNGAKLWIVVGSFRFQPAELARVLLAVFMAAFLYDRRQLLASSWRVGRLTLPPLPYLLPVAAAIGLALASLALQNDLGMAALTSLAGFAIIAGSLRSRWSVAGMGAAVGLAIWIAPTVSPRVGVRVGSWLNPWRDPTAAGYQFIQSEYALAVGGIGGAPTKPDVRNVPEVQTDFVLAAIGALSGILVSAAVLVLLAVMVLRCAQNSLAAATELESQLGVALTILLGLQILLILGGVLRLLPLTGLTVPLVSYGGTSMVVTGLLIGVVLGIGASGARASTR